MSLVKCVLVQMIIWILNMWFSVFLEHQTLQAVRTLCQHPKTSSFRCHKSRLLIIFSMAHSAIAWSEPNSLKFSTYQWHNKQMQNIKTQHRYKCSFTLTSQLSLCPHCLGFVIITFSSQVIMWLHPCTNELIPVFSEQHMHISIRKPTYSQLTTKGCTYVESKALS